MALKYQMKKVVRTEEYSHANGVSRIDHLICGHVVMGKGSASRAKKRKCTQCPMIRTEMTGDNSNED